MKAFVMKEIGRVGIVDEPVPKPGPNDAVVHTIRLVPLHEYPAGQDPTSH